MPGCLGSVDQGYLAGRGDAKMFRAAIKREVLGGAAAVDSARHQSTGLNISWSRNRLTFDPLVRS